MVAPLIAGAARGAAGAARAGARITAKSSIARNRAARKNSQNVPGPSTPTGRSIRIGRALRRREVAGRAEEGQRAIAQNLRRVPFAGRRLEQRFNNTVVGSGTKKVKAFWRIGVVGWSLAWFYPIQLVFAFLFFVMLGGVTMDGFWGLTADYTGFTAMVESMMFICWMVLIGLGVAFMLYAVGALFVMRVPVWRHSGPVLMFAVCLAGYFAPILFFFPWVFLWLAVVFWSQK